jgi:DNA-binding XRE family transcriptional regulator
MLAVVKTPHIKIHIEGTIPPCLITLLKKEYGKSVRLVGDADTDEEFIDVFQTDWFRRTKARLTPGKNLRIYRQNSNLTQSQLGKLIAMPKQYISNMENGIRPISKKMAITLAKIFKTSVARFIG